MLWVIMLFSTGGLFNLIRTKMRKTLRFKNLQLQRFLRELRLWFKHTWHKIPWKKIDWAKFKLPVLIVAALVVGFFGIYLLSKLPPQAPNFKTIKNESYQFAARNKIFESRFGLKENKPLVSFSVDTDKSITLLYKPTIDGQSKLTAKGKALSFEEVEPGLKIQYQTLANGIKEEIVLEAEFQRRNTFLFEANLQNAFVRESIKGFSGPVFYDQYKQYLFHFEKPFAIDAAGNRTDNVSLQIENKNDSKVDEIKNSIDGETPYIVRLTVDENWLNDPARVYPITIDPTIVHDTSSEFSVGQLNRVKDLGSGSSPQLESYYQELAADQHTVALWHMNEGSGTSITDSSGNGNTGTLYNNAAFATSNLGTGVSFDGTDDTTDDYISLNNASIIGSSTTFTIEAWINYNTSAFQSIYGEFLSTNGETRNWFWISTSGTVNFDQYNPSGGPTEGLTVLSTGTWHHIAYAQSGSNWWVYVDGNLDNYGTNAETYTGSTPNKGIIGARAYDTQSGGFYGNFNGTIDELRISKIARSAEEIKLAAARRPYSVYTSDIIDLTNVTSWNDFSWLESGVATGDGETLSSADGLIAQWNFNETSGTTADNAQGTAALDGTLTNFNYTTGQDLAPLATGGTITRSGGYTIHTFTSSGTFTPNVDMNVEVLVVGGGGGGANTGSGGGGGGYVYNSSLAVSAGNIGVTVGNGGAGGSTTAAPGAKGGNSVFSTITAEGGGYGVSHGGNVGGSGGSGGGGSINTGGTPAAGGTGSQGSNGGAGYIEASWVGNSGGGGGAGGVGTAGGNTAGSGNGGVGLANSISGTSTYYAGGGGGGEVNGSYVGAGGNGGGGSAVLNAAGGNGTANTGGGGAGGSYTGTYFNGGNGGSGIVIVRYPSGSSGWTANNKRWGAGALTLDGINDTITSSAINNITNQLTVETWIKPTTTDGVRVVVSNWTNPSSNSFILFSSYTSSKPRFRVGPGGSDYNADSSIALVPGVWYYLVGTYDGSSVKIYVNGQLTGSTATSGNLLTTNNDFDIGSYGGSNFFSGIIDSTRIYSRALTASEILSNYNSSNLEVQTRVGDSADANDGTWEDWKPTTNETQVAALNADAENWGLGATANPSGGVLQFNSTNVDSGYIYWKTLGNATTLATGDTIEYDVYLNNNTSGAGGFDVKFTDATYLRDVAGWTDQNSLSCHPGTNISSYAYQKWFHRVCTVPAGANGKIISYLDLVNATSSTTPLLVYYDNFVIKNSSGTLKSSIYTGGNPTYNISDGIYSNASNTCNAVTTTIDLANLKLSNESTIKIEGSGALKVQTGSIQADANTLGLWHLDETGGSGAYLKDSGNNAYHGTPTGTTAVEGISGKARSFNGSSDYVAISHASAQNSLPLTMESWFRTTGTGTSTIINKYVSASYNGYAILLVDGGLRLYYFNSASNYIANYSTTYGSGYNDGRWHYVVTTIDSTGATMYVDGNQITKNVWAGTASAPTTTQQLEIGRYNAAGLYFAGQIDEVKISNNVKSAEEVAATYRLGSGYYLNRTLSSTDLSSSNKLPFYIASDKLGTFSQLSIGESAYANYQNDSNTVGFWHLDDKLNSLFKDNSIYNNQGNIKPVDYGTGKDGVCNVTASMSLTTTSCSGRATADAINFSSTASTARGSTSIVVSATPTGLAAGDEILIINLQDTTGAYNAYYNSYETKRITFISGTTIYLDSPLIHAYNGTNQKIMVQRIPQYTNVNINSGYYLTATAWNGTLGGIVFFRATGTVTVTGSINMDSRGYYGGAGGAANNQTNGYNGEGTNAVRTLGGAANYGGGNAGIYSGLGGGGAGSYGVAGTANNNSNASGSVYGYASSDNLYLGSGGGGGSTWYDGTGSGTGGAGGAGGGAIFVVADTITITGTITTNGTAGGNGVTHGSGGGGGSGGTVTLIGRSLTIGTNLITATGGAGGTGYSSRNGGTGGAGRINLHYTSLSGSTSSPASTNIVIPNPKSSPGKIGVGQIFNGTSDYIQIDDSPALQIYAPLTISAWFKTSASGSNQAIIRKDTASTATRYIYGMYINTTGTLYAQYYNTTNFYANSVTTVNDGKWHHAVMTISGTTLSLYLDGAFQGAATITGTQAAPIGPINIGAFPKCPGNGIRNGYFNGVIDEVQISNTARSASDIAQIFAAGSRTHNITIDFKAKLGSGNLIADVNDKSFTVDETAYGSSYTANHLFLGDKIIVKENYDGTEYIAQGTVNAVNFSTGAVTVAAWDTGSTFPTSGFTADATVFKWQREYFDITNSLTGHRDATTLLTYYINDGLAGANIWLDDLRSSTNYLTNPLSSTITSAVGNRYFQYRTIFSQNDVNAPSASLTSVTLDYTSNTAPTAPTSLQTESLTNPTGILDLTPEFSAIHNDPDSDAADYYEIEVNTASDFNGTVMWDSGQQSMTETANGARSPEISYAGTALTYSGTTYYWRIRFWDTPGAVSPWSSTQTFSTNQKPNTPTLNSPSDTATNQALRPSLQTTTTDANNDYLRYKIELCTNQAMTENCQTFDQTSSQANWSGQNTESNTAYASSAQATYDLPTNLQLNTTYYWRSYAIDPAGSNSWSDTQATPYSFTTVSYILLSASNCHVQVNPNWTQLTLLWTDNATAENYYEVQRSVDGSDWTVLDTAMDANSTSLIDSDISSNHTYQYRVAPYVTGPTYAAWCTSNLTSFGLGSFKLEGLKASGLHFD